MSDILLGLTDTPLPTILVLAGILFVFLGLGGTLSKLPGSASVNRIGAGVLGLALILAGAAMHVLPMVLPGQSGGGQDIAAGNAPAKAKPATKQAEAVTPAAAQQADGPLYRLRPETVPPKHSALVKMALGADMPIVAGQEGLTGAVRMAVEEIQRQQMLAYDDNAPSLVRIEILSGKASTAVTINGEVTNETETNDLEGLPILAEYKDGRWRSGLVEGEATRKQKLVLSDLFVSADHALPKDPVPVGHTWHLSGDELRSLVNMSGVSNVKGDAYFNLNEVVECGDHQCALMKFTVTYSAEMIEDGVRIQMKFLGDGTGKRSLKWFHDMEGSIAGRMTMTIFDGEESTNALFTAEGPFKLIQTIEIEF